MGTQQKMQQNRFACESLTVRGSEAEFDDVPGRFVYRADKNANSFYLTERM